MSCVKRIVELKKQKKLLHLQKKIDSFGIVTSNLSGHFSLANLQTCAAVMPHHLTCLSKRIQWAVFSEIGKTTS